MKYLIFGGPGIGDTIFELALAKSLRTEDKNAEVDILISNSLGSSNVIQQLLEYQNYVKKCYVWSKKDFISIVKVYSRLVLNKYDYAFSCCTDFKATSMPSVICKLIGCKSIVRRVHGKTDLSDFQLDIQEDIHIVEQYQELCRVLYPDSKLDVNVFNKLNDIDKIEEISIFNQRITICLGANITIYNNGNERIEKNIKEWELSNWIRLCNNLISRGYKVCLIGGKKEAEQIDKHKDDFEDADCYKKVGKTTIGESLEIIEKSNLVIGADTGMMHCAAALGKKTISLFGGTDEQMWRPFSEKNVVLRSSVNCAPCYGKDYAIFCEDRMCMKNIMVEDVLNIIDNMMGDKNGFNI